MKRFDIGGDKNAGNSWISIADAITALFFVFLIMFIVTTFIENKQETDFNAYVNNMIEIADSLGYQTYGQKIEFGEEGFFASGSAQLSADAKLRLDILADSLRSWFIKNDQLVMIVIGHTDDIPVKESSSRQINDNWDLSAQRAKQTRNYFVDQCKFPGSRVLPAGFADQLPKRLNNSEEGRSQNRRVELFLTHMKSIGGKIQINENSRYSQHH